MKENYRDLDNVVRSELVQDEFIICEHYQLEGKVFTGINSSNCPDWIEILREGVTEEIPDLLNRSTRALLLIKRQNRIFAFPFGFGRFMLDNEAIVKDFGIKVVLNSVDPSRLRSVDTTTFDELTIHERTQTSRSATMAAFGIDIVRDLLKTVTGKPVNEKYGNVITGRDSVQFFYELNFSDFGVLCDNLFDKYISRDYRENFEWFDNLQMVNDPTLLLELNNQLIQAINRCDDNTFHLAPPEVIDWMNIGGFSFTPCGNVESDLLIEKYFEYLNERQLDLEALKRNQVFVINNDGETIVHKWKLYDCVVFEAEYNNEYYILTIGAWFKVDRNFADSVKYYVQTIDDTDLVLPNCRNEEYEETYNNRVSEECDNIITLDRKTVQLDGSSIEVCDLLSDRGQFIHVKPWKSSSTLSHLFAQGRISAVSMLQDIDFRRRARDIIMQINPEFVELINETSVDPSSIEIVFAIIDSSNRSLHERLPFFSKLNLMHTVKLLKTMQFNVTKYKIYRDV
jgi:uncharacterized protein (TIGR04141 family)